MFARLIILLALSLFTVVAEASTANTMLLVQQSYADGVNSVQADTVIPAGNGTELQSATMGIPDSQASTFAVMPITNYPSSMTNQQIIDSLSSTMQNISGTLASAMQQYMAQNGIATGVYEFQQRLDSTATSTSPQLLIVTLTVDQSGKMFFGDPRIVSQNPGILYVVYTPLAVANGLPQSWAYPNAGTIQWQMRDMNWNPLTNWTTINVNGAYDPPQYNNTTGGPVPAGCTGTAPNVVCNPDFGVACLSDTASSTLCPTAYTDIQNLISQNGAQFAILDYTRTLAPVYTNQNGTEVANAALSISNRTANYNGCGDINYANTDQVGYELQETTDRYLVETDGSYSPLNVTNSYSISPTQNLSLTYNVPLSQAANLANEIIDPSGQTLDSTSSMVDLVYIAPLSITGNTSTYTTQSVAPYVDYRDDYYVAYNCTAINGPIATLDLYATNDMLGSNSQRCSGGQFQYNLNFTQADSSPWLMTTANEGFDIYDNACSPSAFFVQRHGCSGSSCTATFYFAEWGPAEGNCSYLGGRNGNYRVQVSPWDSVACNFPISNPSCPSGQQYEQSGALWLYPGTSAAPAGCYIPTNYNRRSTPYAWIYTGNFRNRTMHYFNQGSAPGGTQAPGYWVSSVNMSFPNPN